MSLASAPVPFEFWLFGLTLVGIALLQRRTLQVALVGLAAVVFYKLVFTGFRGGVGLPGLADHLGGQWVQLTNLFGLLTGFALLLIVFVLSAFLDNIAAAIIGGTMARTLFRDKLHIGYIACIVAASNAGGAGSVVGDTTTTMMWIAGVSPLAVLDAYVASIMAVLFCGVVGSIQQQRHSPIIKDASLGARIDWSRVGIVGFILAAAVGTNVVVNGFFSDHAHCFPYLGAVVWLALLTSSVVRRPDFSLVPRAALSSLFLLALVLCASLMPVEHLPEPGWHSAFGLGVVSALFDNIPLTALALQQGGYDWGILAFSVGFGGSMVWFGSSAGVGLSNLFPESRSVVAWVRAGWHVIVAYVLGFIAVMLVTGWHPTPERLAHGGSKAVSCQSAPTNP
ncbi:MAG TPA: citrate transporter [Burkholderiales bacterium]|nr:citrate transporter [Burkholderiales bacterium]